MTGTNNPHPAHPARKLGLKEVKSCVRQPLGKRQQTPGRRPGVVRRRKSFCSITLCVLVKWDATARRAREVRSRRYKRETRVIYPGLVESGSRHLPPSRSRIPSSAPPRRLEPQRVTYDSFGWGTAGTLTVVRTLMKLTRVTKAVWVGSAIASTVGLAACGTVQATSTWQPWKRRGPDEGEVWHPSNR